MDAQNECKLQLETTSVEKCEKEEWKVKLSFNEDCDEKKLHKLGFFVQFCTEEDESLPLMVHWTTKVLEPLCGERSKQPLKFSQLVKVRFGTSFGKNAAQKQSDELHVRKLELMNLVTTQLCTTEQLCVLRCADQDSEMCDQWKEAPLKWPGRHDATAPSGNSLYQVCLLLNKVETQPSENGGRSKFAAQFPSVEACVIGQHGTSGSRNLYCQKSESSRDQNFRHALANGEESQRTVTLVGCFECVSLGPLEEVEITVTDNEMHLEFVLDSICIKENNEVKAEKKVEKAVLTDLECTMEIPLN